MSQRVSFYVNKYIEGDPTIRVGLQRGLISSRVLTKHIMEQEKEFRGSFDDVRNAVRKYADGKVLLFDFKNVYTAFKGSFIDVKSRLACLEIKKSTDSEEVSKIIHESPESEGRFTRLSNDNGSFLLVVKEEDIEKMSELLKKEDIIAVKKGISSVTIHLDPSVKYTPGVYFLIMGQISLNQVNIYDVSSHKSDFTLYVDQKDGSKVHELLHELSEYQNKFCSPVR